MTDFDPLRCPPQFAKWLEKATPEERDEHARNWTRQAMAAWSILKGIELFRKAAENIDKDSGYADRLTELIEECYTLSRELHDYDPTSD